MQAIAPLNTKDLRKVLISFPPKNILPLMMAASRPRESVCRKTVFPLLNPYIPRSGAMSRPMCSGPRHEQTIAQLLPGRHAMPPHRHLRQPQHPADRVRVHLLQIPQDEDDSFLPRQEAEPREQLPRQVGVFDLVPERRRPIPHRGVQTRSDLLDRDDPRSAAPPEMVVNGVDRNAVQPFVE